MNVLDDGFARRRRVVLPQRGDNRHVLGDARRARARPCAAQFDMHQPFRPLEDAAEDVLQFAIPAHARELKVKLRVRADRAFEIRRALPGGDGDLGHARQLVDLLVGRPRRRQFGNRTFEQQAHFEQIAHRLKTQFRHEIASPRKHLEQSFVIQAIARFAIRSAADSELLHDVRFAKKFALANPPPQDRAFDRVVSLLRLGLGLLLGTFIFRHTLDPHESRTSVYYYHTVCTCL